MSEVAIEDELRAIVAEVAEIEPDSIDPGGTLADAGVDTVFVALADLQSADDLDRLAPLLE